MLQSELRINMTVAYLEFRDWLDQEWQDAFSSDDGNDQFENADSKNGVDAAYEQLCQETV